MAARARAQKGLLAIHGLGSGKTRTGLAFAQNYPQHNVVIIVPEGLDYVWKQESEALNINRFFTFITYDTLGDGLSTLAPRLLGEKSIMIADEAHRLATMLNHLQTSGTYAKVLQFFDFFKSFHKVLLLTGTPIYSNESDLRWLLCIAAGKPVVPINRAEFGDRYFDVVSRTSITRGWLQPILSSNIPLLFLLLIGTVYPMLIWSGWGARAFALYKESPEQFKAAIPFINSPIDSNAVVAGIDYIDPSKLSFQSSAMIQNMYDKYGFNLRDHLQQSITSHGFNQTLQQIRSSVFDRTIQYLSTIPQNNYIDKIAETSKHLNFLPEAEAFQVTYLLPILVMGLLTCVSVCLSQYSMDKDRSFNSRRFVHDTARYVSYYVPAGSSDFPAVTVKRIAVEYTSHQIDIWIRFTMSQLTTVEIFQLGIYDTLEASEIFGNIEDVDKYRDNGRLIGNLSFTDDDTHCPKFQQLYESLQKQQAVIYSNFVDNGGKKLFSFLQSKSISCVFLSPDLESDVKTQYLEGFTNKKYQVIILHPGYTEGLSVKGAQQLHILEPIIEKAKRDQVVGRAVRYRSHHHLPPSERKVTVFEWYCSSVSWQNLVHKHHKQFSTWFKNQRDVAFWKRKTNFEQRVTPDEIVLSRQDELSQITAAISGAYKQFYSSDHTVPDLEDTDECCVWNPSRICPSKPPCSELN